MGNLIRFPGSENPPRRPELVDRVSELMLQEVKTVFEEKAYNTDDLSVWLKGIREYFWRRPIKFENGEFRDIDLKRWKGHWRKMASEFVDSKRIR